MMSDEWATTKQARRDESVAYIYIYIYIYMYIYIYIYILNVEFSLWIHMC